MALDPAATSAVRGRGWGTARQIRRERALRSAAGPALAREMPRRARARLQSTGADSPRPARRAGVGARRRPKRALGAAPSEHGLGKLAAPALGQPPRRARRGHSDARSARHPGGRSARPPVKRSRGEGSRQALAQAFGTSGPGKPRCGQAGHSRGQRRLRACARLALGAGPQTASLMARVKPSGFCWALEARSFGSLATAGWPGDHPGGGGCMTGRLGFGKP
jgi:hypothetical protein